MADELHVDGDFDLEFTIKESGVAVNISAATSKVIRIKIADNDAVDYAAAFVTDGSDGQIKYSVTPTVNNEAGPWQAQAFVTIAGKVYPSSIYKFKVLPNLETA